MAQQDANQGNPLLTFSRASEATYWDKNGVLQIAGIDEQREDYDPLTGAYRGLLLEQEDTIFNPTDMLNKWDKPYGEVSTNVESIVDGGTAYRLSPDIENHDNRGFFRINADSPDLMSCYAIVENIDASFFNINVAKVGDGAYFGASLFFESGEILESGDDTDTLKTYEISKKGPNGGQIYFIGAISKEPKNDRLRMSIGGGDVVVHHIQYTGNAWFSSPILSGIRSNVTRARDNAQFKDQEIFNYYDKGSFLIEYETSNSSPNCRIISINNENTFLGLLGSRRQPFSKKDVVEEYAGVSAEGSNVAAIAWDSLRLSQCLNGGEVVSTDYSGWTSGPLVFSEYEGSPWSGWIKRINFHANKLNDEYLIRKTKNYKKSKIFPEGSQGFHYGQFGLTTFADDVLLNKASEGDAVNAVRDTGPNNMVAKAAGHGNKLGVREGRCFLHQDGELDYFELDQQIYATPEKGGFYICTSVLPNSGGTTDFLFDQGFFANSGVGLLVTSDSIQFYAVADYGGFSHRANVDIKEPCVISCLIRFDGEYFIRLNGVEIYKSNHEIKQITAQEMRGYRPRIGQQAKGISEYRGFSGDIYELLVAGSDVSDEQLVDIEKQFANRIGLSI